VVLLIEASGSFLTLGFPVNIYKNKIVNLFLGKNYFQFSIKLVLRMKFVKQIYICTEKKLICFKKSFISKLNL